MGLILLDGSCYPVSPGLQWTDTGIAASYKFINKLLSLLKGLKTIIQRVDEFEIVEDLKIRINET